MNIRIHFRFINDTHIKENIRIVSIFGQMDDIVKEGILKNRYISLAGSFSKDYLKNDVTYDSIRPEEDKFLVCKKDNPQKYGDSRRLGPNMLPMFKEFLKEHDIKI